MDGDINGSVGMHTIVEEIWEAKEEIIEACVGVEV